MSPAKATYMIAGQSRSRWTPPATSSPPVAGWSVEQVRTIASETMHNVVTPYYAEAASSSFPPQRHYDVIIISACPTSSISSRRSWASTRSYRAGGRGRPFHRWTSSAGDAKAQAITDLAAENNYDSPSATPTRLATDIPMLQAVGNPIAVNPDRAMKKAALENGWEIRTFRDPVPLFQMPSPREISIGASIVAVISAAAAGGIWWAQRGRRGSA